MKQNFTTLDQYYLFNELSETERQIFEQSIIGNKIDQDKLLGEKVLLEFLNKAVFEPSESALENIFEKNGLAHDCH